MVINLKIKISVTEVSVLLIHNSDISLFHRAFLIITFYCAKCTCFKSH